MDDEYPTDEHIEQLRAFNGTPHAFVEAVRDLWWPDGVFVSDEQIDVGGKPVIEVRMVTGGWSGNEEIIGSFEGTMFRVFYWYLTQRGGLSVYRVPAEKWDVEAHLGAFGAPRR